MMNAFTATDFLKALTEGSLVEPLTRMGLVKPDPSDQHVLLFSEGGSCGPWFKVPVEVVAAVELIGLRPCEDHEHPFVRLQLNPPPKDNPLAVFFAELARRAVLPDLQPRAGLPRRSVAKSAIVSSSQGSGSGQLIRRGASSSPQAVSSFGWTFPWQPVGSGYFEEETFTIDQNGNYTDNYAVHCSTSWPDFCWFEETVTIQDENHNFIAEWSWRYPEDGTVMSPGNDSPRITKTDFIQALKDRYWDIRHEQGHRVFHCSGPFC